MALLLPGGAEGSGFRESVAPLGGCPAETGGGDAAGSRGGAGSSVVDASAAAGAGGIGKREAEWPLRYLLAWFSVVGAAVGLRLPPAAWQLAARPQ